MYRDFQSRELESKQGYECAARLSDQALVANLNELGTIDVRPLQCSKRDFFVSMEEIKEVRRGSMDFSFGYPSFYAEATGVAGLLGFVLSALVVGLALCIVAVFRWVWGNGEAV